MSGKSYAQVKGRSSIRTGRAGKAHRPPKGEPWTWHTHEMLASDAWKALSINARRLLDFLEIEHGNHAGRENGNLVATYDQLVAYGCSRRLINGAIAEAVALGFLEVTFPGGRWNGNNESSRYRLTFVADKDDRPPSNNWKFVTPDTIAEWDRRGRKQPSAPRQRSPRNRNPSSPSCTTVVPLRTLPRQGG